MKVSTLRPSLRRGNGDRHAMIFYVPYQVEQKAKILNIGRNIKAAMGVTESIFYKTHAQSHAGTAATRAGRNSTYIV